MGIILTVVHIVACIFLIVVVLLQTGKGADMGAVFGGGSQTIFGSSGASNLLTKLTGWTAVVFLITSLGLTWDSTRSLTVSIADDIEVEPPPLVEPASGDANLDLAPFQEEAAEEPSAAAGEAADVVEDVAAAVEGMAAEAEDVAAAVAEVAAEVAADAAPAADPEGERAAAP